MTKATFIALILFSIFAISVGVWLGINRENQAYEQGSQDTRAKMEQEIEDLREGERSWCEAEKKREYGRGFMNGMKYQEYVKFKADELPLPSVYFEEPYIDWSYGTKKWIKSWDQIDSQARRIAEEWERKRTGGETRGSRSGPP